MIFYGKILCRRCFLKTKAKPGIFTWPQSPSHPTWPQRANALLLRPLLTLSHNQVLVWSCGLALLYMLWSPFIGIFHKLVYYRASSSNLQEGRTFRTYMLYICLIFYLLTEFCFKAAESFFTLSVFVFYDVLSPLFLWGGPSRSCLCVCCTFAQVDVYPSTDACR